MKQIIYVIWVCLITGLFACEDALDMSPENSLTFSIPKYFYGIVC